MRYLLVRDLSPVLDTAVREISKRRSMSLSEAAKTLMHSGLASNKNGEHSDRRSQQGLGVGLMNTFKGVFQSDAEHAEFEADLENFRRAPDRQPPEFK